MKLNLNLVLAVLSTTLLCTQLSTAQQLPRYSCIFNRVDLAKWTADSERAFDEEGILLSEGNYHPVNICRFGLMSLELFEQTNDLEHLKQVENQVKYFKNARLTRVLFDGKGLGLPYNFEYKGLLPPWYSGMAQGLSISFLLRYTEITNDSSAYNLITKLAYTMLQPEENGGCLSRTPENLLWIEEYPNAPQSPQVLNGAIFALFGLLEYTKAFPNDTRAIRILNECLEGLKTALPFYDSVSWTKYNRRAIYPNRFDYIHLQIFQMWQLYDYVNDPFYLRQACIWAGMIQGKTNQSEDETTLFNTLDIAVPGKLTETDIKYDASISKLRTTEENLVSGGYAGALPKYVFATQDELEIKEKKVLSIDIDSTAKEVHLFYKYHWDKALFKQEKWQAKNGVSSNTHQFYLQPGYYQFAVFVSRSENQSTIKVNQFHLSDWIEE